MYIYDLYVCVRGSEQIGIETVGKKKKWRKDNKVITI